MEVLNVQDLTKIYGSGDNQVTALHHVSFQVKKGEFVAIVGASGSGKSTLMNLIGGIDRPTSGRVTIDGKQIFDMNESELAIFRRRNSESQMDRSWNRSARLWDYLTAEPISRENSPAASSNGYPLAGLSSIIPLFY